jgi:excisionase family DNA binding protein
MTSMAAPDRSQKPRALLSPSEVSRYLGVPLGTLANWRYQGRGPAFLRVGRHVRYRSEDVATWVDEQLADNPPASPPHARATPHLRAAPR